MGPPNQQGRAAILRHYLTPLRLAPGLDADALARQLAEKTRRASSADLQHLCQTAARICVKQLAARKKNEKNPAPAITQAHFLQALKELTRPGKKD